MCGIVGIVDIKNKVKHGIEYINSIQNHRGPDEFGIFKKQSIGLSMAMTRLSIVGVQEAHQPYVSTDGYVVTFNGEIFNEKSLYKDRKITVPTGSTHNYEAELICLLYKKYGNSFLDKLNGMFSIAVYDPKRNTILLARDRFGIKPLYYLHNQRVFCYSSEIQPLIECLEKKVSINDQSVYNYFSVGYIPNPETIYSEIDQVKPGCIVELNMDTHRVSSSRWWRLNYNYNYNFSIDEWYENINYQLDDSVKKWGNSDVPITYLLSGGIDSSSIVALAAQRSSGPINTYSLGFDGEGESQWSELSIARKVSNKYCTNHTEIILNPGDLADSLYAMNKHLEQPYSGGLPSWAVFKEISKNYKVAITGTGGDEIFGNYNRGQEFASVLSKLTLNNNFDKFDSAMRDIYYIFTNKQRAEVLDINKFYTQHNVDEYSHKLYENLCDYGSVHIEDKIAQIAIDSQLTDDFLMMTDRFSMAHSIEARTPFLDHNLVELVFSMPTEKRVNYGNYKSALKKSMGNLLPKEVLSAKKHGFNIPLSIWMRGRLRELVEDLIGESALKNSPYINQKFYNSFVTPMLNGNNEHITIIWSVLMFQLWHDSL